MTTGEQDLLPSGLRVIEVSSGWALGEIHGCVTVVWADQPDPAKMKRRADVLVDVTKRHPAKSALVEIVEPTSKPPNDATRKIGMEVFRQIGNDLSAIAFVVEGPEMRTAITRAVITGMLFFVPQIQPSKVFKRPLEMMQWIAQRIHNTDPAFASSMIEAMEYLRRRMHAERDLIHSR